MDISKLSIMNQLSESMKYRSRRQEVISQNVANVDIPGYKRRDIKTPDFNALVKSNMTSSTSMVQTNPMHLSGSSGGSDYKLINTDSEVMLDMEAVEMMKNTAEFDKASATYKKMLRLFTEAIGNK